MSYQCFRQIGAPNVRDQQTTVVQSVRHCCRRVERLLARPKLPPVGSLLATLTTLRDALDAAHTTLPLRRLVLLRDALDAIYDAVEDDLFANRRPNGDATKALARWTTGARKLLHDLTPSAVEEPPATETVVQISRFLEAVATRGWRVGTSAEPKVKTEQADGFDQSWRCIKTIAANKTQLLSQQDEFGVVTAPILLLPETVVPETVLVDWAKSCDVYVVYGSYVVVTPCQFIGVVPQLVKTKNDEIKVDRFETFADMFATDGVAINRSIIPTPRRIQHHYYVPVVNIPAAQRKYFKQWDILTQP